MASDAWDGRLAPCPFCGGEAYSHAIEPHSHGPIAAFMPDHPGSGYAECLSCSAAIAASTEAEAVAAWNTRADLATARAEGAAAREQAIKEAAASCVFRARRTSSRARFEEATDCANGILALPLPPAASAALAAVVDRVREEERAALLGHPAQIAMGHGLVDVGGIYPDNGRIGLLLHPREPVIPVGQPGTLGNEGQPATYQPDAGDVVIWLDGPELGQTIIDKLHEIATRARTTA